MIGDRKTNIFQHFWKSWSHRQKVDFLEKVGLAQRHMASFVTEQCARPPQAIQRRPSRPRLDVHVQQDVTRVLQAAAHAPGAKNGFDHLCSPR